MLEASFSDVCIRRVLQIVRNDNVFFNLIILFTIHILQDHTNDSMQITYYFSVSWWL